MKRHLLKIACALFTACQAAFAAVTTDTYSISSAGTRYVSVFNSSERGSSMARIDVTASATRPATVTVKCTKRDVFNAMMTMHIAFGSEDISLKTGESFTRTFTSNTRIMISLERYQIQTQYRASFGGATVRLTSSVLAQFDVTVSYSGGGTSPSGGGSSGGQATPVSSVPFTGEKALVYHNVLRDKEAPSGGTVKPIIGLVEIKTGKAQKNGQSKVSGYVWLFDGTKRYTISGTAPTSKTAVSQATLTVKGLGTLKVQLSSKTALGRLNGDYLTETMTVGGSYTKDAEFLFDGSSLFVPGTDGTFLGLLPDGEPISINGAKWTTAKAGKVKMLAGSLDTVDLSGENYSGLKLTYNVKTGIIKGSFTVYTATNGKLRRHKANVSGAMVSGKGWCSVTVADAKWYGQAIIE